MMREYGERVGKRLHTVSYHFPFQPLVDRNSERRDRMRPVFSLENQL